MTALVVQCVHGCRTRTEWEDSQGASLSNTIPSCLIPAYVKDARGLMTFALVENRAIKLN